MSADTDTRSEKPVSRRPRRRWARGSHRPEYLRPDDVDQMMIMFVALMSEVSSLRDRIDTHEALAELGNPVTSAAVEAFKLAEERRNAREEMRQALLKRVLRVIVEDREAALDHFK